MKNQHLKKTINGKVKKPLILIKYNVNPELHRTMEHTGVFKHCTEMRMKFFSKKQWKNAVLFYLECSAPITTVQQIAWALPSNMKLALVRAEYILNWVNNSKEQRLIIKDEIK
jgi:hypothetical protein